MEQRILPPRHGRTGLLLDRPSVRGFEGKGCQVVRRSAIEYHLALAQRLRLARETLSISEEEAAAAAGVILRTYRRWEAGNPGQSSRPLFKLGRKLGVNLDWLFSGKPFDDRVLH